MQATIQKWGNSQGVRINKELLEQSRLAVGEKVEIVASDGQVIIIRPMPATKKRYKLEDLVARIPKVHEAAKDDFGAPVGQEEW